MMILYGAEMKFDQFKEIVLGNLTTLEELLKDQNRLESEITERDLYYDPDMSFVSWFEFSESFLLDSNESYDDSQDGDHQSALASAGWGTDEDYGSISETF